MVNPYMKAPHAEPGRPAPREAPNAALLIDFDNVTMGMRSDLAKELKRLLDSDIIKGKVTVQRAYADWRRYPQYIVPLSEASIDLIFAPAYGSSKKNATDIRMAIDGMELVFIRPEIGTFILLTGDSDFSSLVLKLKEYGKYVVGIGIQESSSDILVQNCDEYYSYTSLTGLHKATGEDEGKPDAWQCVEDAVGRMVSRGDVMRSDRLKQVMMEVSPGFDERSLGFKSFSKFLVAASKKGLVDIERGQNGQYVIGSPDGPTDSAPRGGRRGAAGGNGGAERGRGRRGGGRNGRGGRGAEARAQAAGAPAAQEPERRRDPRPALKLLRRAVRELAGKDDGSARDSDVKRRMLALDKSFDESAIGFGKFSKFLQFAEGEGTVALVRARGGSFEVRLARPARKPRAEPFDARALELPVTKTAIGSYLANRYKGVGVKTAARLVEHFGADVFSVLHRTPERVRKVLTRGRANTVLAEWEKDYGRRRAAQAKPAAKAGQPSARARAKEPAGRPEARTKPKETAGRPETRGRAREEAPARGGDANRPRTRRGRRGRGGSRGDAGRSGGGEPEAAAVGEDGRSGLLGLLPWGRRRRDSDDSGS